MTVENSVLGQSTPSQSQSTNSESISPKPASPEAKPKSPDNGSNSFANFFRAVKDTAEYMAATATKPYLPGNEITRSFPVPKG